MLHLLLALRVAVADELPTIDEPFRSGASRANDAAVVVGIEDYYQFPDVPFATADARAFRDLAVYTLGIPSDRVKLLTGAVTKKQMTDAVDAAAKLAGSSGRVWVYFAGHGMASPTSGDRVLLAGDVPLDATTIDNHAIGATAIRTAVDKAGAKLFFMTDACFTGKGRDGQELIKGKRFAVLVDDFEPVPKVTEWVAASAGQVAGPLEVSGHGAFTYFAVGALRGWADGEISGSRDDTVTLNEAKTYVERMLRETGNSEQTPIMLTTNGDSVALRAVGEKGPDNDENWTKAPLSPTSGSPSTGKSSGGSDSGSSWSERYAGEKSGGGSNSRSKVDSWSGATGASGPGLTTAERDRIQDSVLDLRRGQGTGWALVGVGAGLGSGGILMGLAGVSQPIPEITGGSGLVLGIIAGPLVAGEAERAREVLRRFDLDTGDSSKQTAGWVTYGVGVASGVGVIAWGASGGGVAASAAGLVPLALCVTAVALFEADATQLRDRLDREVASNDQSKPKFDLAFSPAMMPIPHTNDTVPGVVLAMEW